MTKEELDELIEARKYIVDAECGPRSINWYREIIDKLKSHKEHGTPSIACTIDFIHEYVMIDADILIDIYEKRVKEIEHEVEVCKALIEKA